MTNGVDLRLGLSMRVMEMTEYVEIRDVLAHDWSAYLKTVLLDAHWIPVPNIGKDVCDFIEFWELNGFILTGGNNINEVQLRDETEWIILEYAIKKKLPVFGICRGMQMICHYCNLNPFPCPNPQTHIASNHSIKLINNFLQWYGDELMVNSFHSQCVGMVDSFTGRLIPFAIACDGLVEGVIDVERKLCGIMWHPERKNPASKFDNYLIQSFFSR